MPEFTEADVALAERYAAALQTIHKLSQENDWNENDVEFAEKCADILNERTELSAVPSPELSAPLHKPVESNSQGRLEVMMQIAEKNARRAAALDEKRANFCTTPSEKRWVPGLDTPD